MLYKRIAVFALAFAAYGRSPEPALEVTVQLHGDAMVPMLTLAGAKTMAASMFAAIGVRVRWADRKSSPDPQTMHICFTDRPRATEALATAQPYASAGNRATVFYDAPLYGTDPALLAHVLLHELGHVLEGIARHSETGVMKVLVEKRLLGDEAETARFTEMDRRLIHARFGRNL